MTTVSEEATGTDKVNDGTASVEVMGRAGESEKSQDLPCVVWIIEDDEGDEDDEDGLVKGTFGLGLRFCSRDSPLSNQQIH